MRNIWLDGIMGVVVGDALGLPVQFLEREELDANPATDMIGYRTFNLPEGTWSDDSSLTLATLQSILDNDKIDAQDIMENFADWLGDGKFTPFGQSFDQGQTCVRAITKYIINNDIERCGVTGEWANGNGALMRIMPICLYAYEKVKQEIWTDTEAIDQVHKISSLTHNHLRSQIACGIYYFLVKAILDEEGKFKECLQIGMDQAENFYHNDVTNMVQLAYYSRIFDLDEFAKVPKEDVKSSGYVVDSLEAALWSILNETTFEGTALRAINLGKDTDTVGAIACGLASLYYGYQDIPAKWLNKIQRKEEIEKICIKGQDNQK